MALILGNEFSLAESWCRPSIDDISVAVSSHFIEEIGEKLSDARSDTGEGQLWVRGVSSTCSC